MRRNIPCCRLCHVHRLRKGPGDTERKWIRLPFACFLGSHSFQSNHLLALAAHRTHLQEPRRNDVGLMNVTCGFCGALHWMKERVVESSLICPRFPTCCRNGFARLPFLPHPPPFLQSLLETQDRQSIEYLQDIRQYNMGLAFTSLGVTEDCSVNRQGGFSMWRAVPLGGLSPSR
jgi:hypothetical protein